MAKHGRHRFRPQNVSCADGRFRNRFGAGHTTAGASLPSATSASGRNPPKPCRSSTKAARYPPHPQHPSRLVLAVTLWFMAENRGGSEGGTLRLLLRPSDGGSSGAAAPGEPPLADLFRQAMRRVAATVNVVTICVDGQLMGMTATAMSCVSMDPPSLLVCINQALTMHAPMEDVSHFAVNVLHRRPAGHRPHVRRPHPQGVCASSAAGRSTARGRPGSRRRRRASSAAAPTITASAPTRSSSELSRRSTCAPRSTRSSMSTAPMALR